MLHNRSSNGGIGGSPDFTGAIPPHYYPLPRRRSRRRVDSERRKSDVEPESLSTMTPPRLDGRGWHRSGNTMRLRPSTREEAPAGSPRSLYVELE
jgi:hypothetical protein